MPNPSTTSVRRAHLDDLLPLFKMSAHMHRETDVACLTFDPERALSMLPMWISSGEKGLLLVAERDGQLIGMLAASIKQPWFSLDHVAAEDLFYVAPEHRGSRAAYMLMRGYIDWVKKSGVKYARAGVATGKGEAAEHIYRHFGMKFIGGNYSLQP